MKRATESQERLKVNQKAKPPVPFPIDARKAQRISIRLPMTYTLQLSGQLICGQSKTINVSGLGAQFTISEMVSPQTLCSINLSLPNDSVPLYIVGHVMWCRKVLKCRKDKFEVGIGFSMLDAYDEDTFSRYCHFLASQLLVKYLG